MSDRVLPSGENAAVLRMPRTCSTGSSPGAWAGSHSNLQVVESFREGRKVKQRVIATLIATLIAERASGDGRWDRHWPDHVYRQPEMQPD